VIWVEYDDEEPSGFGHTVQNRSAIRKGRRRKFAMTGRVAHFRTKKTGIPAGLMLALLVLASAATAQVQLSFSPTDTTVSPEDQGRLSILIADSLEIRTIDVTVTYDTTVVRSLGGAAGRLYTDSGIVTFQGFEENAPGTWYGYAVILGVGLFVKEPGELFTWDFEGLNPGTTPITTVTVYLATTDGGWFSDVTLPGTTITVQDPLSAVGPPATPPAEMNIYPNPFNPRTEISYDLRQPGLVRLDVFDLRGRLVTTLLEGVRPAGPGTVTWDGKSRRGREAPGGVYLFLLQTPSGVVNTRGLQLK